jgi:uncharacterized membrane protein
MLRFIKNNWAKVVLWVAIASYITYFSVLTVLRFQTLHAHYFDLGIMHQTVYNTYKGLATGDLSRVLELTNPHGWEQVKRMAVHNDIFLALLSPFYFIDSGPETLLVIQTVVLALGALAVFKITLRVFDKKPLRDFIGLTFALAYLLYPAMERANLFDFHAVTLATSFLLWMIYFWLESRYFLSFVFLGLSLLTKEQVALTTAFFGLYTLYSHVKTRKKVTFPLTVILVSVIWFALSIFFIIPAARGGANHFALSRYQEFGDTPIGVIIGFIMHPYSICKRLFHKDTYNYLVSLFGPLGFLSPLSPIALLVALPELAINILSSSWNMKTIIYHYTSVIQPFVFLSSIYGAKKLMFIPKKSKFVGKAAMIIIIWLWLFIAIFTYFEGPLPFAKKKEIHPFKYPQKEAGTTVFWAKTLKDEALKIATTGKLAPLFTSRRYFYNFSEKYDLADYIVIRLNEIYNYPEKDILIPVYEKLKIDLGYELIYHEDNFEVYKKVKSEK